MKKTLAMILAVVMLMTACVAGTLAWLQDKTDSVVNTFTVGNIDIELDEVIVVDGVVDAEGDRTTSGNSYKMIPGQTYTKDPEVRVLAGNEECYLFVKFEELNDAATYLTYTSNLTIENGWTQGTGTIPSNVWYRTVAATETTAENTEFQLLKDNQIQVKDTVTKDNIETAAKAELKWTAYAIQTANTTDAATAWGYVTK